MWGGPKEEACYDTSESIHQLFKGVKTMTPHEIAKICGSLASNYSEEAFRTPGLVAKAVRSLWKLPEAQAHHITLLAWHLKQLADAVELERELPVN